MSTHKPIPDGISEEHVIAALGDLDRGVAHDFREPTQWVLVHKGRSYAPKAAVGLAARYAFGAPLGPREISSGEGPRQAVGYLRSLGFTVVPIEGGPVEGLACHSVEPRVSMSHPERAIQIWHMLVAAARNRQTLTYKLVSEVTGAFPAALGEILAYLMRYCEQGNLPPLTVLVVQTGTGKPGDGLLTSADHDADRERVFEFNWYRLRPPSVDDLVADRPKSR
jgi:hypothetical protein